MNAGNEDLVLAELKKISKILMLANAKTIEEELSKLATSDARKKMWVLMDGERMPKDIAREVGVTVVSVSYFLNAGAAAGLIQYTKREPPVRILDCVPPSWIDLIDLAAVAEEETTGQEQNELD